MSTINNDLPLEIQKQLDAVLERIKKGYVQLGFDQDEIEVSVGLFREGFRLGYEIGKSRKES